MTGSHSSGNVRARTGQRIAPPARQEAIDRRRGLQQYSAISNLFTNRLDLVISSAVSRRFCTRRLIVVPPMGADETLVIGNLMLDWLSVHRFNRDAGS